MGIYSLYYGERLKSALKFLHGFLPFVFEGEGRGGKKKLDFLLFLWMFVKMVDYFICIFADIFIKLEQQVSLIDDHKWGINLMLLFSFEDVEVVHIILWGWY